jgi:DNA-binding NtrC family response regulator
MHVVKPSGLGDRGSDDPSGLVDRSDRFTALVQSPLRASLLRHLHQRPDIQFSLDALAQHFARLPQDVQNCLDDLVEAGLVRAGEGWFEAQNSGGWGPLIDALLKRPVRTSVEETSPAAQHFRDLMGRDEKMLVVFESIRAASKSEIAVLILGPTGSGKEVAARMIHELGPRRGRDMQALNCAALPDTLFESEMFGYEKGAFTGAAGSKPGRVELAHRSTLFLDEIADMSSMGQAKLLRVLQERRFERLGGSRSIDTDFRLICATNRPLEHLVREGRFREDLYYRVNAFAIRLPSLRERQVDIPVLAQRFLARYCAAQGLPLDSKGFSKEALETLCAYHWPGNIRELESTVSRAALSAPGRSIRPSDIEFLHTTTAIAPVTGGHLPSLAEAERTHIVRVLEATDWNKKEASRVLGISRGTLYRKILEYRLEPETRPAGRRSRGTEA